MSKQALYPPTYNLHSLADVRSGRSQEKKKVFPFPQKPPEKSISSLQMTLKDKVTWVKRKIARYSVFGYLLLKQVVIYFYTCLNRRQGNWRKMVEWGGVANGCLGFSIRHGEEERGLSGQVAPLKPAGPELSCQCSRQERRESQKLRRTSWSGDLWEGTRQEGRSQPWGGLSGSPGALSWGSPPYRDHLGKRRRRWTEQPSWPH